MKLFLVLTLSLVATFTLTYADSVPEDYELQEIPINGRLVLTKKIVLKGGSKRTIFISREDGLKPPKEMHPRGNAAGAQQCYFSYPELPERVTLPIGTELTVISRRKKPVFPSTDKDCFTDHEERDNFHYEFQLKDKKGDLNLTMSCYEAWVWRYYETGGISTCWYWHSPLQVDFIGTNFDLLMP